MKASVTLIDGLPGGAAGVDFSAEAFQFGLGVFTTIGVRGGKALWLEAHHARLVRDAAALRLPPACTLEEFIRRCEAVVAGNDLYLGGLKVIWYSEAGSTHEWLSSRPNPYTEDVVNKGRRLTVRRCLPRAGDVLRGVKSLNYAEHLLATREAKASGFDDALWVDEDGSVLEAATASVVFCRKGQIYTPPLSSGILRGLTREKLVQSGAVKEMPLPFDWLAEVEAVFVTNALGLVMPVVQIDERTFDISKGSPAEAVRERLLLGLA